MATLPIPNPPRSYGHLIDAGETLFYFVLDVGLFRSRDNCATCPLWCRGGEPGPIDVVFSCRAMIVSTWRGAIRTSNHSGTWDPVAKVPSRPFASVVDRAAGVLIGTANGVYRSADDGASWTHLGFTGRSVGQMITTPRGEIYAAVDRESDRTGAASSVWRAERRGSCRRDECRRVRS